MLGLSSPREHTSSPAWCEYAGCTFGRFVFMGLVWRLLQSHALRLLAGVLLQSI